MAYPSASLVVVEVHEVPAACLPALHLALASLPPLALALADVNKVLRKSKK